MHQVQRIRVVAHMAFSFTFDEQRCSERTFATTVCPKYSVYKQNRSFKLFRMCFKAWIFQVAPIWISTRRSVHAWLCVWPFLSSSMNSAVLNEHLLPLCGQSPACTGRIVVLNCSKWFSRYEYLWVRPFEYAPTAAYVRGRAYGLFFHRRWTALFPNRWIAIMA